MSLAFLARGDGNEPLLTYLPPRLQAVGAWPQGSLSRLQELLASLMAQLAVTDLPPELTALVRGGVLGAGFCAPRLQP